MTDTHSNVETPENTTVPPETIPPVEPEQEDEWEGRARRMGWRPLEEYHGPKDRWVDAKTFVERGETEHPILRERIRKLDDRLVSTERELMNARATLTEAHTKIKEQSDVINEIRDLSRNAEQRAYVRAHSELSEKERRAVAEADTGTYDRIQVEKRQLEETRPAPKPTTREAPAPAPAPTGPTVAPNDAAIITQWVSENPWYNNDMEMNSVATSLHGVMRQQNPMQPLTENLAAVRERMVQLYPHKFANARRAAPSSVSSPTPPAPKPKGKTVNDLPAEAKAALAKIKKDIPDYKDSEYLRLYFGEGE